MGFENPPQSQQFRGRKHAGPARQQPRPLPSRGPTPAARPRRSLRRIATDPAPVEQARTDREEAGRAAEGSQRLRSGRLQRASALCQLLPTGSPGARPEAVGRSRSEMLCVTPDNGESPGTETSDLEPKSLGNNRSYPLAQRRETESAESGGVLCSAPRLSSWRCFDQSIVKRQQQPSVQRVLISEERVARSLEVQIPSQTHRDPMGQTDPAGT
ncbi:hypothetical protein AAES_42072 [Amazona aestiva]|uniref:Uncharacterized protein n=1 Tax=Amazona aestiva TaxID=12930 RepID=A0A0Q3RHR9_AMAAE|nr:hypothetical protein AAES_42072 [Amazona aestiva]